VCRNPQHRGRLTVVSATSAPPFQPLCHQWNFSHPEMKGFTWQTLPTVNRKHFFMNTCIICIESFCSQKNAQQNAVLRLYTPQARSPFWLLKPASELAHARLLLRLPRSWTVLLPSDTHRKPITSITAAFLPFMPYLLFIPRMYNSVEFLTIKRQHTC
jgi:hypothetical protein